MKQFILGMSLAAFVLAGCLVSLELYINCYADASENHSKTFEYYYHDPLNEENSAMSNTNSYTATKTAQDTIEEIEQTKIAETTDITKSIPADNNNQVFVQNDDKKKKKTTKAYPVEPDTELGSYTQLINRDYPLPEDYEPDDLVVPDVNFSFNGVNDKRKLRKKAANALETLFEAAEEDNVYLYGVSGYRSYNRQSQIYNNNLITKGSEYTNKYSAIPGTSEHQAGLAIDLSAKSVGLGLTSRFGTSDEGKWLKKNAWKYGWILRYEETATDITGYAYEPWHIRYVGKKVAKILHRDNICLEEYYGYKH